MPMVLHALQFGEMLAQDPVRCDHLPGKAGCKPGLHAGSLRVCCRLQAYLAGLTFALAASPCSTPILATLLAYVSTTNDPSLGAALLLAYTTG